VELSKPLLNGDDEAAKEETRRVMGWVIDQCLILLHPIMPFITEELWGALGERAKMVVHADWPTYSAAELVDPAADREMNWVISLIEGIRSARSQMRVLQGLRIPMIVTELDDAGQAAWDRNEAMILKLGPCG
jgi:valyl-tRNA synthetase